MKKIMKIGWEIRRLLGFKGQGSAVKEAGIFVGTVNVLKFRALHHPHTF